MANETLEGGTVGINGYLLVDVEKMSPTYLDLGNNPNLFNARVGDNRIPLRIWFKKNGLPLDLTGKDVYFKGVDFGGHAIEIQGTVSEDSPGDDLSTGRVTFFFKSEAFRVTGKYDADSTFFGISDSDGSNLSTVNVGINVLPNRVDMALAEGDGYRDDIVSMLSKLATIEGKIESDDLYTKTDAKNEIGDVTSLKMAGDNLSTKIDGEFEYRGVNVEWYGAKGDGVTDDTAAIQSAIDQNPGALILLKPDATYNISSSLVFNKNTHFDGRRAKIHLTKDCDYAIKVEVANSTIENFELDKDKGTAASGILVTYDNNTIQNIVSKNCVWKIFMQCVDMKESHIRNIRVDNDVSGLTGSVFQFDHCLNNTMSDAFFGYADNGLFFSNISSQADPNTGYENEGFVMQNVIIVKTNIAVNIGKCTFLAISNSLFDFCQHAGVQFAEGFSLTVTSTWIQVMDADAFCIGAASDDVDFGMVSVQGNSLVGQLNLTNQSALNMQKGTAAITGNTLLQIKGGKVFDKTSSVTGNVVENGIGFYGYDNPENILTYYPTSTAIDGFPVKNSQITLTVTDVGTNRYLYAVGNVDTNGTVSLTSVANSGIAIASISGGTVVVVNDPKDYTKTQIVCKSYPMDHRIDNNTTLI